MKRLGSQLTVAAVCCILGFMISYQFKIINIQGTRDSDPSTENKDTDITVEIEQMKKEKSDLETKVNDLQGKIKAYEKSAASNGNDQVLSELKETRIMLGIVDVKGPGITMTITPQDGLFTNNQEQPVFARDLVTIVNALNSADAEAISINDIRITMKTGIRDAGNAIYVDEDKISPYNKITIKAIGDKKLLDGELNFKGAIPTFDHCVVKIDKSDKIVINKCNNIQKFKYAKPTDSN